MTTLSDLQAELTHLEPHQLHQVAEFIEQIKRVSHTPKKLTDFYGAFATRSRSASKTEMPTPLARLGLLRSRSRMALPRQKMRIGVPSKPRFSRNWRST
jgi:hypothetical protein